MIKHILLILITSASIAYIGWIILSEAKGEYVEPRDTFINAPKGRTSGTSTQTRLYFNVT